MANQHKDILRKGAEAPAEFLDRTIATSQKLTSALPTNGLVKKTEDYWHMLGPGLTTGASDDDPSGIATYSQTGAQFGYHFLWLAAWTFPLSAVIQEMCARIGLVTGRGLAGNIRVFFSRRILYMCGFLLFVANAVNIGADLGAMAKAAQLLNPRLNFGLLVVSFTLLSLFLQIFTPYVRYARYLKWLAMVLLAYVFSALLAHLDWAHVISHAWLPSIHFQKDELLLLCAILGTTISPYLFFWQTSQEVEEQILQGKTTLRERSTATAPEDVKSMRIDVWSGMLLSEVVMFFIIAACGGILYTHHVTNIQSAAQAAEALRPFAGNATYFLFAAGIIGTGLLAIPVLAGASSYTLSESFRWKEGLYRQLRQAHAFYGVIIISMLIGLGINFLGIDPIKALIYAAFVNGLVAPIILALIVIISSNHKVMGRWTNKRSTTALGWGITGIMALAGIAGLISLF
ncbi:MAG TPA: Nramp family divalent metal transporter [Candidatus Saccharimonadales bacterium]|nr:Nramp family divalent metal transporter [Candidatus Saccharimonadales bacterium]